jgi:hypothetical protein
MNILAKAMIPTIATNASGHVKDCIVANKIDERSIMGF